MLGLVMLFLFLLLVVGAFPAWPHSRGWGYFPSGGMSGLLLVFLLVWFFMGGGV